MAAQELAEAGAQVTIVEAKPSIGRKFLMAGKSGLNLTKNERLLDFQTHYYEAQPWLAPMLAEFGPEHVIAFANSLGQEVFTGSSGRVFPKVMKASPLLRAWLARLDELGVQRTVKWRWLGWEDDSHRFETPNGEQVITADAVVFALGGASWSRLGSDGAWADVFEQAGIDCVPFAASNAALDVSWSAHMRPFFGHPLKAVSFQAGDMISRGEAILSSKGLEGGGVYSITRAIGQGAQAHVDLKPDWTLDHVQTAVERSRGKASLSNHLRKTLRLGKLELALLNEWAHPLPQNPEQLATLIKALPIKHGGLRAMDEAISTSGGVAQGALDAQLMLNAKRGHFCAGEMLDWDAPTGGYLLTGCFATGRWAGRSAARYLGLTVTPAPSPV